MAQDISGKVFDLETGLPLPFVNVHFENSQVGTSTDSSGLFRLRLNKTSKNLIFSLVGYDSRKFLVKYLPEELNVDLKLSENQLKELVVKPGENPAWEIIRRVQKNADQNNPLRYKEFQAEMYAKSKVDLALKYKEYGKDSTKLAKALQDKNLNVIILENAGKFYYRKGQQKEIIEHTVTNVPKLFPVNLIFSNDYNPLGFYQAFFRVALAAILPSGDYSGGAIPERNFVNPIKPGSFAIYDFELIDTLFNGVDSTFIIKFSPYAGKSVDALKGEMHINSKGYALQYIKAKQADSLQILQVAVEQNYLFSDGRWYPDMRKVNFEFPLKYKKDSVQFKLSYDTRLKNFKNKIVDEVYFDGASKVTHLKADTTNQEFFKKIRPDSLSAKDSTAYESWSFSKFPTLKKFVDLMEYPSKLVLQAGAPIGPFVLLFNQNVINYHEKLRIGIGFQNNLLENPRFGIRTSIGYGLGDRAWKHQASLAWYFTKDRYNKISFYEEKDIRPPGRTSQLGPNFSTPYPFTYYYSPKGYLVNSFQRFGTALYLRPIRWTWFKFFAEKEIANSINYSVQDKGYSDQSDYLFYGFMARFARKENIIRTGLFERITNNYFPVIHVNARYGNSQSDNSHFVSSDFDILQQFRWEKIGFTRISLSGGYAFGSVPYYYLFNTLSGSRRLFGQQTDGFLTNDFTSYAYNQFASLNVVHNFGKNIFRTKIKWFQPEFAVGQRFAWSANTSNQDISYQFKNFSKGNFEASLYLNNIIRVRFLGLYWGISGKCAYNYSPDFQGNRRLTFLPSLAPNFF